MIGRGTAVTPFQGALDIRDAYRVGELTDDDLAGEYQKSIARLNKLTQGRDGDCPNDVFARHLHRHTADWFLFQLEPTLPATNYQAEQALRTPIVNRKVFGGNRTEAGCQAQVITSSTIQTCRQQKRSAFAFLRDAVCGITQSIITAITG